MPSLYTCFSNSRDPLSGSKRPKSQFSGHSEPSFSTLFFFLQKWCINEEFAILAMRWMYTLMLSTYNEKLASLKYHERSILSKVNQKTLSIVYTWKASTVKRCSFYTDWCTLPYSIISLIYLVQIARYFQLCTKFFSSLISLSSLGLGCSSPSTRSHELSPEKEQIESGVRYFQHKYGWGLMRKEK